MKEVEEKEEVEEEVEEEEVEEEEVEEEEVEEEVEVHAHLLIGTSIRGRVPVTKGRGGWRWWHRRWGRRWRRRRH